MPCLIELHVALGICIFVGTRCWVGGGCIITQLAVGVVTHRKDFAVVGINHRCAIARAHIRCQVALRAKDEHLLRSGVDAIGAATDMSKA